MTDLAPPSNRPPTNLAQLLAGHLDAPIRMLTHAIDTCPDDVWTKAVGNPPVWQHVLHATYYLQKWMRTTDEPFSPPAFVDQAAVDLVAPAEPAITRDILRDYIDNVADGCRIILEHADNHFLLNEAPVDGVSLTLLDRTLTQIRHLVYHVDCISTIIDRYTGEPMPWLGPPRNATE